MRCPYCGVLDVGVVESRLAEESTSVRRRRECNRCHKRFTTYERVDCLDMTVVKKDGRREAYNRDKLKRGLIKATWKRSITMADIEKMLDEIERSLRRHHSTEFDSNQLGQIVLDRLKELDFASYLAFASVYYNFDCIEDYKQALTQLENDKQINNHASV